MTLLQIIALALVAIGAAAVVLTPEPLRQTMVAGIYGIALTFVFFTFQAPDVALSELVVSSVALPLIVLAALRKIRTEQERYDARRQEKEPE